MDTFVTTVFGTPGGTNIRRFQVYWCQKEEFNIDTEEIVLASISKPSKGSFFKGLGDSELQIHLVPDQSLQ